MKIDHYKSHDHLLVALDCIIFGFDRNELKLLLIKRDFEPEKGNWSLMGGFLRKDESLNESAERILNNLTGLRNIYLEQLHAYGEIDRDPVERTISVAYYALIDVHTHDKELVEQHSASWFPINEIPDLIFDHQEMVKAALKRLRYKASHQPVGFELLPEKFTLPELQKLYEGIYDTRLDKRNFRRRILSMDVLIKTDEKQKKYSKKGAFLYKFDQDKYTEKVTNGDSLVFKPLRS
ncbi:NUDIX hydrolase [Gracilimonas mengyeensis]|uniref:ADP-ribose pyrophosphatase YjhB, NUDIX family n=1 Tax=Gracilimonas mengyeensis TaxID=1302730 RepID=A0A521AYD9_9BACT|nr:NUDIX domain-containing protein [Gracilimonas mengyeensis]SMO39771.1 ADP-ribose pyrophosphatase YjhB, NUDIX family [Gracilimonas mengyeensis]